MNRMRVAFFGGTFDPIHRGHLRLAAAAAEAFALDRVLFAPVGLQPLKTNGSSASFADRMAMTALALTDPVTRTLKPASCDFLVSNLDAPRPDGTPNYTVDTLAALAGEYPAATLFVLTGADSFLSLRNWRSPVQLLALADWIVVSRPDFPLTPEFLTRPEFALTPAQRSRVHLLTTVHEDVSSTDLRSRLRTGDPCPGLLPPAVANYIQSHNLYR
jgi:nicotinate-nucleotide adenylyltransferase